MSEAPPSDLLTASCKRCSGEPRDAEYVCGECFDRIRDAYNQLMTPIETDHFSEVRRFLGGSAFVTIGELRFEITELMRQLFEIQFSPETTAFEWWQDKTDKEKYWAWHYACQRAAELEEEAHRERLAAELNPRYHEEVISLCFRDDVRIISRAVLTRIIEEFGHRVVEDDGVQVTVRDWQTSGENA